MLIIKETANEWMNKFNFANEDIDMGHIWVNADSEGIDMGHIWVNADSEDSTIITFFFYGLNFI